jgi:hypothetical protein
MAESRPGGGTAQRRVWISGPGFKTGARAVSGGLVVRGGAAPDLRVTS